MGGLGGGGSYGPVYPGHNAITTQLLLWRARHKMIRAAEAILIDKGIEVPNPAIWSPYRIFWFGFACGMVVGGVIGFVFWELT